MVITSTGKTDLRKRPTHFQERILKLPLEVSWTAPTGLFMPFEHFPLNLHFVKV